MKPLKGKTFKIGLRIQLLTLVILVAILSLTVLAIITGIYFTTNFKTTREDRLQTIAQLKASQMEQTLNFLYYQVYWLTVRDPIQSSLVSYRAGNTSVSNWASANFTIVQFLQSSLLFSSVRLYDTRLSQVFKSATNSSTVWVPAAVENQLFPLDNSNATLADTLDSVGMITGPISNGSDSQVMSMTLPVFYTGSILFESKDLVGYVSAVMSAESFQSAMNDNTTLPDSKVMVLAADPNNGTITLNSTFRVALPVDADNVTYRIRDYYTANQALRLKRTGTTRKEDINGVHSVLGYCPVDFELADWAAVIQQKSSTFDQASTKLTHILIGVSIGTAAFVAIVTFPLTHWAVQPILRLQKATELISTGRGLQPRPSRKEKDTPYGGGSTGTSLHSNGPGIFRFGTSISPQHGTGSDLHLSEAGSVSSVGEAGIGNSYLHNARIPQYSRFFDDELSKLTRTFNAMTDELDRQYTHLEERVKERTKQLEAAKIQAEKANDAKTVFIANISHELRTPLNGILGMTAIAMAETDTTKVQQSLKLIFRSGELLLHILTELLTFSKNSLKRSKLENADFGIMEIALQIKSIFGKLAKDQNVKLSISITPNVIRKMVLFGDSNRIIQIVMNLVSNSLKFTPVDGSVTVTIKNLGEYDEQRSRLADFKDVYVKSTVLDTEKADEVFDTESPTTSNDTSHTSSSENEDTDAKSIATVSSSSYDDTIFKTQLKLSDPSIEEEKVKMKSLPHEKMWVFEFAVADTGPGIEKSLQEAVFEPFIQGDQTLSRQYGGTGLGLSICRQLATMMHGVMKLESTVGIGSKFIFRVPLVQRKEMVVGTEDFELYEDEFNVDSKKSRHVKIVEPKTSESIKERRSSNSDQEVFTPTSERSVYFGSSERDSPVNPEKPESSDASSNGAAANPSAHLKVLVAEDNNVNQEVIKRMLNLEGITNIQVAKNGEDAIDLMRANLSSQNEHFDIVFMDVQMPKVDGLMATKTIRVELGYTGPIVALTAFADESNVRECLECGMVGFLSKPIRRTQLRQVLSKFCFTSE